MNNSDIEEKLDKIINYISGLKIYCDKIKDQKIEGREIQEIVKCFTISIDILYTVLKKMSRLRDFPKKNDELNRVLETLKSSYIISDKCIEKINNIDEYHKNMIISYEKNRLKLDTNLSKAVEALEDVLDELFDYLSY